MAATVRWHLRLLVTVVVLLAPVTIGVLGSFKTPRDLYAANPFPTDPTLQNYASVLAAFPLGRLLLITCVVAVLVTALQLAIALLAAYAVVHNHSWIGQATLFSATLSIVIPIQTVLIPQFIAVSRLGWLNTFAGLILPQLAGTGIVLVLLHRQLEVIPPALAEAARLDGAGRWQILRHIVVPMLRPALAAVGILQFVTVWNEYVWPLLAAPDIGGTTIQVGLALFGNTEGANPGPLLAAAVLSTTPPLITYLVFSRRVSATFLHAGVA